MPYCQHCGGQVTENANFCTHCGKANSGMAAAPTVSLSGDKDARINQEWNDLAPLEWGSKKHANERAMLSGLLEDDEHLECLVSGNFGPDGGSTHTNLGVATDRRLIFLRQTKRANEAVSLPYYIIDSISFDMGWMGGVIKATAQHKGGFKMDSIQPKELAKLFAETVQPHLAPAPERISVATEPAQPVVVEADPVPMNETFPVALDEPVSAATDAPISVAGSFEQEWVSLAPIDWGNKKHANERAMLEGLLEADEHLVCLVSGDFAPDGGWTHINLGVATDRRLIFLRQAKHSDEVVSLPYYTIDSISFKTGWMGGVVNLTSRNKRSYQIGNIQPKERATLFAETVQPLIAAAPKGIPIPFTKEERIEQEWEALIPKGWGTFGDKGMHSGERGMLPNLLEDDETLECLVGGKFGPDLGRSHIARDKSLHSGVGVATDRRVIFLDAGFLSTEVAELPYSSIETISYSTGMAMGGLKISARGSTSLQMEMVKPMGQAKVFADAVRKHLNTGQAAGTTVVQTASAMDELEKAAALYERGLLTQEEFAAKKAQLLNS